MSENKTGQNAAELKISGILSKEGVRISEQSSIDALSQRGYGTIEEGISTLTFYEALFLSDKGMLEIKDEKGDSVSFQDLLKTYEKENENAWANYLVYRDLRSRGYVVREGFGAGIDFRVYERGSYGKETAPYLILNTQEGKPMPMVDIANALERSLKQKKELILAVMNRRGEIVYYSLSQLTFKMGSET